MISRLLPRGSKRRKRVKHLLLEHSVPNHISRNFIKLRNSEFELIKTSLENNFFSKNSEYLATEIGKQDLLAHLTEKIESIRKLTIPWLDSLRPLRDAKILEIGCGTGPSTVALAEQGAKVTAIDIDDKALSDAKTRCDIYGLNVDFYHLNSTEAARFFSEKRFDIIIFWACLEHMTHEERMIAMKKTWDMLPSSSLWCVTGTPNRLYFYDSHTSQMPFFHWLPDEVAIKYAQFSPRQKFSESFTDYNGEQEYLLQLYRWGRGISFHEFELTMKTIGELSVLDSMSDFHRKRWVFFILSKFSSNYRYESFLHKIYPTIHRGFFQPYLDLIIQKD